MAGLIQQSMQPGAQPGMPPERMPPEASADVDPDTNEGYVAAMQMAMKALYEDGAAKKFAESMAKAPDKIDSMANIAYEIVSAIDERTDGAVPDELLALFATNVLQEVADIGDAAGVQLKPAEVAGALKQMILRFVGEQGGDTTQLEAAMSEVDPAEFDRMAEEGEAEEPQGEMA